MGFVFSQQFEIKVGMLQGSILSPFCIQLLLMLSLNWQGVGYVS